MKKIPALACCGLILLGSRFGGATLIEFEPPPPSETKPKLDAQYEPTPDYVVDEMLEIADVGENDVVYDLGCGDGRVVIRAAERRGARGVGIDLDPARIAESWRNAQKANVTDRVRFIEGNLFDADISQASVVMLYLTEETNHRLIPKLLSELKPGTRVVSHNHDMGAWRPDEIRHVDGRQVYLWIIPQMVHEQ